MQEHVVDGAFDVTRVDPEAGGRVALRIEVEYQDPEVEFRECGAQVHRGRGLADPAFLVRDRDHTRQLEGHGHRAGGVRQGRRVENRTVEGAHPDLEWSSRHRLDLGLGLVELGLVELDVISHVHTFGFDDLIGVVDRPILTRGLGLVVGDRDGPVPGVVVRLRVGHGRVDGRLAGLSAGVQQVGVRQLRVRRLRVRGLGRRLLLLVLIEDSLGLALDPRIGLRIGFVDRGDSVQEASTATRVRRVVDGRGSGRPLRYRLGRGGFVRCDLLDRSRRFDPPVPSQADHESSSRA